VHVVIVHCLKTQLMHCALKCTLKHNHSLTHCGRVTQVWVFNTVKLGTSASSP